MQFQEDFLGKNAQKPPLTRIPVSIKTQHDNNSLTKLISKFQVKYFLDFKPGGGLCQMLLAAFRFKSEHGWRRFEIPSGKVVYITQFTNAYSMFGFESMDI